MELPVRILTSPSDEPVIGVDGLPDAPGLALSHWPGNRTPRALRHDLSTGCALAFARLPRAERERLAAGCTAIANDHYDTDGTLALFTVRYPERALPHADRLLAAARAGDFFQVPDETALALDAIVSGLAHSERSPLAHTLAGMEPRARWEACTGFLHEVLPELLAGDLADFEELWRPVVEATRTDLAALGDAARAEEEALDLTSWTKKAKHPFDPGRHALFGSTRADRALVLGEGPEGTTCRLVVSTLSWFDLETERRLPRPDLVALAGRLNELEDTTAEEASAWRAQRMGNASPELWFGGADVGSFAERNGTLAASRLAPEVLRTEVRRALTRTAD